jgi:hypothetical protein
MALEREINRKNRNKNQSLENGFRAGSRGGKAHQISRIPRKILIRHLHYHRRGEMEERE